MSNRRRLCSLLGLVVVGALAAVGVSVSGASADSSQPAEIAPGGSVQLGAPQTGGALASLPKIKTPAIPAGASFDRPTVSAAEYAAQKAAAAKAPKVPKPAIPTSNAAIGIVGNVPGTSECGPGGCWYPPDINGAVAPSAGGQTAEIVNSKLDVFNKTGTLLAETSLNSFCNYGTEAFFDPRIEYDQIWNRWVIMATAFKQPDNQEIMCLAVSNNSNLASGGYIFYLFNVDFGLNNFFDYDQIGLSRDGIVITGNIFPDAGGYAGATVFGLSKALMYNGLGQGFPIFTGFPGTTTPTNVIDGNPRMHLLTANGNVLDVQYRNPQSDFYGQMFAGIAISGATFSGPPLANQAGSPIQIDTLDGRFPNPSTQYGDNVWATHTIALGPFPAPKFYDFDVEGGGADTIKQSGFYFASGSSDDWAASIVAHTDGRVFVNWTSSDTGTNARMYVGGRISTDPNGAINFLQAANSPGPITNNGNPSRWGDTSSVRTESLTGSVASAYNELSNGNWLTQIVRFSVS